MTQAIYPYLMGGGAVGAHELANLFSQSGLEVAVHTVDYRRPPEAHGPVEVRYTLTQHRFPHLPWDRIGTAGNPFAWRVYGAVRDDPAPVVHLRSHLFFTSLFGALGARKSGKAIVLSVHGVRAVRSRLVNALQEVWIQTVGRFLFRVADRVVCQTAADRDEVLRYGARPARTAVLFNTFDAAAFFPGPSADAPVALWVGRHVEEKGVAYLLNAWARVQASLPAARLALLGDGPLRKAAEAQAADLGIAASVRFDLFQPQVTVGAAMRSCRVFVLPSIKEGFPRAVVEAMACGKPVVTTDGLKDIVADAGRTVPARDPAALAAALLAYLEDPVLAATTGERALRRAREEYSLAKLGDAYLRVYGEAVAERQKRRRRFKAPVEA